MSIYNTFLSIIFALSGYNLFSLTKDLPFNYIN